MLLQLLKSALSYFIMFRQFSWMIRMSGNFFNEITPRKYDENNLVWEKVCAQNLTLILFFPRNSWNITVTPSICTDGTINFPENFSSSRCLIHIFRITIIHSYRFTIGEFKLMFTETWVRMIPSFNRAFLVCVHEHSQIWFLCVRVCERESYLHGLLLTQTHTEYELQLLTDSQKNKHPNE